MTLCNPWNAVLQTSLSFIISQSLLRLMSFESVMPSSHLILSLPLLLPSIFSSIRVFSNESVLRIRGPKYWSFSFSISPSNEYSGWFPLRLTGLILLSKGLSRVFSSTTIGKQLILQCSAFFMVQLSHDYWKNYSFDYTEFVLYNTWICFIWWIIILRNNYLFSCSNCPKMG